MLSLAMHERGIRLLSTAIVLLPLAALVCVYSHSAVITVVAAFAYCAFFGVSFIAFLFERAEEEEEEEEAPRGKAPRLDE